MAKMDENLRQLALGSKTVSLQPTLQAAAPAAQEPVVVQIFVRRLNDRIIERMKTYFVDGKLHGFEGYDHQAGGVQKNAVPVLSGLILPSNLVKVASLGEVERMTSAMPQRNEYDVAEADDTAPKPPPRTWQSCAPMPKPCALTARIGKTPKPMAMAATNPNPPMTGSR